MFEWNSILPYTLIALLGGGLFVLAARAVYLRSRGYRTGDHVVYLMPKCRTQPGVRAENVRASKRGENYAYFVRKPWTVARKVDSDHVEVVTRGGKRHVLKTDDPLLHHAGIWESLVMRFRWHKNFPAAV